MISIGDYLKVSPGERRSASIPIVAIANHTTSNTNSNPYTDPYTNTSIPITILNGKSAGPTLVVLSGIHGSEYLPILTSHKLAHELNFTENLRGAVILVHIANLPAYLGRSIYVSPADGMNLNRIFPGSNFAEATISEKIAYFLVHEIYPLADCVLDVHAGDGNEQLFPSYAAYYAKAGSEKVIHKSKNIALAFGLDLVVEFQWKLNDDVKNGEEKAIWAGSAAVVRGIPSIDVELAPGMGLGMRHGQSAFVDRAYNGILNVMQHLDMISKEEQGDKEGHPCIVRERYFIEAPIQGSWIPLVDAGSYVKNGTLLGYMTDLYGRERIFEAIAPSDGLLLIRFEAPPALIGDTVAVLAVLNETDVACVNLKEEMKNGNVYEQIASMDPMANNMMIWKWAAAAGWIVAFGLGIAIGRKTRGKRRGQSYQHANTHDDAYSNSSAGMDDDNDNGVLSMNARVV